MSKAGWGHCPSAPLQTIPTACVSRRPSGVQNALLHRQCSPERPHYFSTGRPAPLQAAAGRQAGGQAGRTAHDSGSGCQTLSVRHVPLPLTSPAACTSRQRLPAFSCTHPTKHPPLASLACIASLHILQGAVAGVCQHVGGHHAALARLAAHAQGGGLVREGLLKLGELKRGGRAMEEE
jgi:hypothetical protein